MSIPIVVKKHMENFEDRVEAGTILSEKLEKFKNDKEAIVIGLPRGGLVVAFEISKILRLPIDIIVVRKIGAPGNPEFAIGAIDEIGQSIINEDIIEYCEVTDEYFTKRKNKLAWKHQLQKLKPQS